MSSSTTADVLKIIICTVLAIVFNSIHHAIYEQSMSWFTLIFVVVALVSTIEVGVDE